MCPDHCDLVYVVLHMSGCHIYLTCPSCFGLQYYLNYQGGIRWKFVSNYLQMMYEQLKKIKQFSWVLEWIFSIYYISKNDLFPFPWWKLVLQNEYKINEIMWETSTKSKDVKFWWIIKILWWVIPPYGKNRKISIN